MNFTSFVVVFTIFFVVESKFYVRFKSASCESSLKSSTKTYCFLKSYTRKYSFLNYGFTLNRKIDDGLVCDEFNRNILPELLIFQMYIGIFRQGEGNKFAPTLHFPDIEWCKNMKLTNLIPILEMLRNEAILMGKDVIEFCDRTGEFKFSNVTHVNSTFVSKFPAGDYKVELKFYDKIDVNIFAMNYTLTIKQ